MTEKIIKALECKKVEQKKTETDKGTTMAYIYQFQDEDKDHVITLKSTRELDYVVGQDVEVTIERNQTTIEDHVQEEHKIKPPICEYPDCEETGTVNLPGGEWFCDEHVPEDVKQIVKYAEKTIPESESEGEPEGEAEPELEEPPMYPEPEVTEEEKANDEQEKTLEEPEQPPEDPGCKYYYKGGLCSNSLIVAPFCVGPTCTKLVDEADEPEQEVVVPKDFVIELSDGSIAMEILKGIAKGADNELLLASFIKTYKNYTSEEFDAVLDWLDEQGYIGLDVDAEPHLTDKGRERIAITIPGCDPETCEVQEEKGSPDTPSKEKTPQYKPRPDIDCPPEDIDTLKKEKKPAKGKIICEFCGKERVKGGYVGEKVACKRCWKEQKELDETAQALQEEQVKELHEDTPLENTLDALTNGDTKSNLDSNSNLNIDSNVNSHLKTTPELEYEPEQTGKTMLPEEEAEELAKTEAFEKKSQEFEAREAAGEPSTLLCKRTNFPTNILGGIQNDIIIEKNMGENFLYAHAQSIQEPVNGVQIQKFCHALKLKTGCDWTHVTGNTFNADKEQLNRVRGEKEELI